MGGEGNCPTDLVKVKHVNGSVFIKNEDPLS